MAKRKWNAITAKDFLKRNRINVTDKIINVKRDGAGLTCWSAIDYLCNNHKMSWRKV